jgi:RNA polymerase sigma-54 factor
MVAMEMDFDLLQEQRQRNLPRLIEANYLLNLSSQELETVIMTELSANPALEVEERTICPTCGSAIDGGYCATCLVNQNGTTPPSSDGDDEFDRIETIYQPRATTKSSMR